MLSGYISLSYEVIWFRAFIIGTNRSEAFALILSAYLGGLAGGSWWARRYFMRKAANAELLYILCIVILLSSVIGFSVLPLAARAASFGGWREFIFVMLVLIFVQTLVAGMAFPLLCHIGFSANDTAGFHLSLLYFGNILGSVAGSLITGFILIDRLSTAQTSVFLAALGAVAAAAVAGLTPMSWPRRAALIMAGLIMVTTSPFAVKPFFDHYYERIIYKGAIGSDPPFVDVVENKSGVVTVNTNGVVYGGGMYDGLVSVDLIDDKNFLIRPLSLALFHPDPREVLMIGLGTGAWAQVLVNNPKVKRLTIIEINPGYLSLIAKYPVVMTVLTNPKVEIHVDDGRRWMNRYPNRKFDAIVQNTTFNFRPNATNVLSAEYLRLSASHLRDGGVLMYNTTGSDRAQRTGCMTFSYALRELNVMVASNAPLHLDRDRLRAVLENYTINGQPVFDRSNPLHRARLDEILATLNPLDQNGQQATLETCQSIMSRTKGLRPITDDNMGEEWQQIPIRTFAGRIDSMFRNLWSH
jgi:predicted membrane-bound spermidine synthase